MNLIEGTVMASGSGPELDIGDDLTLPIPPDAATTPGSRIVYGSRPEHFKIGETRSGHSAEIALVEPAGFETHLHASLGAHTVRITSTERLDVAPGDQVSPVPETKLVHLFDAESGLRLA